MCGIGGIHLKQGQPALDTLQAIAAALAHRGPDDEGIEIYGTTAFVHRRLSIIDLSTGHQPLKSPDGLSLIVNGEIYNYQELKQELANQYPYRTLSDSEVLLPLYEQYGLDFLKDVRGMYALALYDPNQDRLILSRDPFGIKQLYYVKLDGGVAFASEPQALVKASLAQAFIHPQAQAELLEGRYTPGSQTIFGHIKRVMPGETLIFEKGTLIHQNRIRGFNAQKPEKTSEQQAMHDLEHHLKESVHLHLRSDVPYGLFLSGGLDSGILLHLMSQETSQPINTFTIGFDDGSVHDERFQAQQLAKHYQTNHQDMLCTQQDFWSTLPLVAQAVDDPVFDHALVPTYMLAKQAAQQVRVVLCGEGGDELLAGYRRYQRARLPWWLGGRLMRSRGVFEKAGLHSSELASWQKGLLKLKQQAQTGIMTPLQQAQFIDCQGWLAHSLLIKLDRCLMAHGLEGRTPFLEPSLGIFCANLPDTLKIQWGQGKYILRKYIESTAPHLKPFAKKKGFKVPVDAWIREKGPRLAAVIAKQPGIEELFDHQDVMALMSHPKESQLYAAWMLLFYALWHQIHIVGVKAVPDTLTVLSKKS